MAQFSRIQIEQPAGKKKKSSHGNIHPDLPQPPFFVGIVGPRHRGKTVLLHNILERKSGMYGQYFKKENMVLFSPTYQLDDTLHDLKLTNVFSANADIKWLVSEMKQQQETFRQSDNMAPVLLVMEDITQIRDAFVVLEDLGYTGRHYNIQVLYVAHKMSSIFRGIRTQTQQWILFEPHEESEWEFILEMFARRRTKVTWENAMRRAWKKPYNFVFIDFEQKEFSQIYKSGFHDPLFTPKEEQFITSSYSDLPGSFELKSPENEFVSQARPGDSELSSVPQY